MATREIPQRNLRNVRCSLHEASLRSGIPVDLMASAVQAGNLRILRYRDGTTRVWMGDIQALMDAMGLQGGHPGFAKKWRPARPKRLGFIFTNTRLPMITINRHRRAEILWRWTHRPDVLSAVQAAERFGESSKMMRKCVEHHRECLPFRDDQGHIEMYTTLENWIEAYRQYVEGQL